MVKFCERSATTSLENVQYLRMFRVNRIDKMTIDTLKEDEYSWLLKKDLEIYPTDKPVTESVLKNWYVRNPEFGITFREGGKIIGTNIVIPLNREGWQGLIDGKLLESDCKDKFIFDCEKDCEIGIHIYHIRKEPAIKRFYTIAMAALAKVLLNLKKRNNNLKVVGFSGLCVTNDGIGLFYNKLNCKESAVKKNEYVLMKNKRIELFELSRFGELERKLNEGYEFITRCKMLVLYPDDPSIVWSYINI
jgi:hypothetical protein